MNLVTKEQLDPEGDHYDWKEVPDYDISESDLQKVPLNLHNGFEMLDFINALPVPEPLTLAGAKRIESLLARQIPAVKGSRASLSAWIIEHLNEILNEDAK